MANTVKINDSAANGPELDYRDGFGVSVAAIGDLNGDGLVDLAAGAFNDSTDGKNRGAVHVMFMNSDGSISRTVKINNATANGPELANGDHFGVSVAAIGDLNGDGLVDLAAGAFSDSTDGKNRGAVHVMFMNSDGSISRTVKINNATANGPKLADFDPFGTSIPVPSPYEGSTVDKGDAFGVSVAGIGDLNGDGIPDIAAGATGDDEGGINKGAVHVMFMNSDGSISRTAKINGATANGPELDYHDAFGVSVAGIGDLNGDGIPDIAAGAYGDDEGGINKGAVHVMFMNSDGSISRTVRINVATANGPELANFDHFGVSVAAIGDLNGDGIPDIAAGATGDDEGGRGRGAVHVMFMNSDGSISRTDRINNTTANGPELDYHDAFGVSVAGIGDLNGDGMPDIAAGATDYDEGGRGRGAVHVMFMNSDGSISRTAKINDVATNGLELDYRDGFGVSVAGIGDLNGDGLVDLAAGAFSDSTDGKNRGAVHVMFMNSDGSISRTAKLNNATANGPELANGDHFGVSVAGIGDLNGDGTPDIAAGAIGDDEGGINKGAVHVMFMNSDGSISWTAKISGATANGLELADFDPFGTFIPAPSPYDGSIVDIDDSFGVSVAGIGDLNGDGIPDIAAGAYGDDEGRLDRGAVHVMFMNSDGSISRTAKINGATANGPKLADYDIFGISLAGIGDLNGDGTPDIAAGATGDDEGGRGRGAVHVMFMNSDGSISRTAKINGATANGPKLADHDHFGRSLAGIGDLNGDGMPDIAAGATGDDEGGRGRGAVHVMFMNSDGSISRTAKINGATANGPELNYHDAFGVSVAGIGDLNGNGLVDLAAGAYSGSLGGDRRGAVHVMFMNKSSPSAYESDPIESSKRQVIVMWVGYGSESANDGDVLDAFGISEQTKLPKWLKSNLGPWVVEGNITLEEFENALKYIESLH